VWQNHPSAELSSTICGLCDTSCSSEDLNQFTGQAGGHREGKEEKKERKRQGKSDEREKKSKERQRRKTLTRKGD
jgi:hypothetical protein